MVLVAFPKWLANAGAAEKTPQANPPVFWGDTHLLLPAAAPASWQNVFTAKRYQQVKPPADSPSLRLTELFRYFPVAMLEAAILLDTERRERA